MSTRLLLRRVGVGEYRLGGWTLRGIERTANGRQGARINHWVATSPSGARMEAPTLARLREAIEWLESANRDADEPGGRDADEP